MELDVVHALNDIGYNTKTSRSESKSLDDKKIDIFDVDGTLPTYIQVKYTGNTPNYFGIRQDCPLKDKPFTVIWKKAVAGKNSPGTIAMVDVNFFYELLKIYKEY